MATRRPFGEGDSLPIIGSPVVGEVESGGFDPGETTNPGFRIGSDEVADTGEYDSVAVEKEPVRCRVAQSKDSYRDEPLIEDVLLSDSAHGVFAICDGMGGHASGRLAAETAAQTLHMRYIEYSKSVDPAQKRNAVRLAVMDAHIAVRDLPRDAQKRDPGTTLSALFLERQAHEKKIYTAHIAHVGDSRIYFFSKRSGFVSCLTRDDSRCFYELAHSEISIQLNMPDVVSTVAACVGSSESGVLEECRHVLQGIYNGARTFNDKEQALQEYFSSISTVISGSQITSTTPLTVVATYLIQEYWLRTRNAISQFVGSPAGVSISHLEIECEAGDRFLLVSDGIVDAGVTDQDIHQAVQQGATVEDVRETLEEDVKIQRLSAATNPCSIFKEDDRYFQVVEVAG